MNDEDQKRLSELKNQRDLTSLSGGDGIKDTGVILVCEKHGEYPQKVMKIVGKPIEMNYCPMCVKEENERRDAEIKELERKNQLERDRRNREAAGVSVRNENVRFKDFLTDTPERKALYDAVYDMAKSVYDGEQASNLIITGKVGTGKTMLANCAINSLFKSKRVKVIRLQDMLRHIKGSYSKDSNYSESDAIDRFSKLDLLILDEVGVQRDTDLDKNLIFDVLDGRYQNVLPTMIISNLGIDGVKEILGERVVDRLRDGGGKLIGCDWESFRK